MSPTGSAIASPPSESSCHEDRPAKETGLALADFDVLVQLTLAGGALRMTELADRALISRSGMPRLVARLVDMGLVRRTNADADARGVVVDLTDAGVARLTEAAPVHARGIFDLFVARLDDQELAVLESALEKVTLTARLAEEGGPVVRSEPHRS